MMDKHVFAATIFSLLIVSCTCNASSIFDLRRLITAAPNNTSTDLQVASPVGSPVSGPLNAAKSEGDKHKDSDLSINNNSSSTADSKGSNKNDSDINTNKNITGTMSPPDGANKGELNDKRKKEVDNITETQLGGDSSCRGSLRSCKVKGILACIVTSKNGSEEPFLLVRNLGESDLKLSVDFPNSLGSGLPAVEVPKYQTKKINISSTTGKSSKIVLSSGTVNCVLDSDRSVYVENLLRQFSVYSRQVTPIYVASFFFLLALLCGGTWACCKLKKRSGPHDGIPYQELEMGLPESTSAVNVETAEGWDQDWDDDDWDDDSSVRSPGGHKSISANGLTSRSSKKDGWDNDWDD